MNKLPEKWFIKVEPETRDELNDWRKTMATFRLDDYFICGLDLYLYSDDVDKDGSYYSYDKLKDNYEEITFEQFEKFVLKKDNDNWCIKIKQQSLPYINEVRTKNGLGCTHKINNSYVNYYCIWVNDELLIDDKSIKKSYKEITLKEFIDKFSLNYLTKRLENMEKQIDLLNDEFIVNCFTEKEANQVYDWLIKNRNYPEKVYRNVAKNDLNLSVLCNRTEGFSLFDSLRLVKIEFPNHPIYSFNQFKEMYLNPEIKNTTTQKLTITRTELLEIYNIACKYWKSKIKDEYFQRVDLLSDNIIFKQSEVDAMFSACTGSQRPILIKIFGEPIVKFKVGDWITCDNVSEPSIDKIIEITRTHYVTGDTIEDDSIIGYDITNKDLRLATQEEINKSKIKWEDIKTGSIVKLKYTGENCNNNVHSFDFNDSFQVVFYKTKHFITEKNTFSLLSGSCESYCTFYQDGKYLLFGSYNNTDYITEVISY